MKPIEFEEQNVIYAKDQPEYNPLPACKTENGDIATCWELTKEEIEEIQNTGKLWIMVKTFNNPLQPFYCTTLKKDLFPDNK
jgi:thioredoxin-related protein